MARTTKTRTSIWSSQTLTAGAGATTSSAVDLVDGYGAALNIKIANGATGPTVPAEVSIQVSADDTTYFKFGGSLVAGTTNNGTYEWGGIDIPIGNKYLKLVAGTNTGQDVTIDADISEVELVS